MATFGQILLVVYCCDHNKHSSHDVGVFDRLDTPTNAVGRLSDAEGDFDRDCANQCCPSAVRWSMGMGYDLAGNSHQTLSVSLE